LRAASRENLFSRRVPCDTNGKKLNSGNSGLHWLPSPAPIRPLHDLRGLKNEISGEIPQHRFAPMLRHFTGIRSKE
jgi:hypothetical protein